MQFLRLWHPLEEVCASARRAPNESKPCCEIQSSQIHNTIYIYINMYVCIYIYI